MLTTTREARRSARLSGTEAPPQLRLGFVLVAVVWPTAWFGPDAVARITFFPLWLGYILTVDGLVEWRTGTSIFRRDKRRFAALFVVSIPLWWVYEALNSRLDNWSY